MSSQGTKSGENRMRFSSQHRFCKNGCRVADLSSLLVMEESCDENGYRWESSPLSWGWRSPVLREWVAGWETSLLVMGRPVIDIKFGYYNQMLKIRALDKREHSPVFLPAFPPLLPSPPSFSQSNNVKGIQSGILSLSALPMVKGALSRRLLSHRS